MATTQKKTEENQAVIANDWTSTQMKISSDLWKRRKEMKIDQENLQAASGSVESCPSPGEDDGCLDKEFKQSRTPARTQKAARAVGRRKSAAKEQTGMLGMPCARQVCAVHSLNNIAGSAKEVSLMTQDVSKLVNITVDQKDQVSHKQEVCVHDTLLEENKSFTGKGGQGNGNTVSLKSHEGELAIPQLMSGERQQGKVRVPQCWNCEMHGHVWKECPAFSSEEPSARSAGGLQWL